MNSYQGGLMRNHDTIVAAHEDPPMFLPASGLFWCRNCKLRYCLRQQLRTRRYAKENISDATIYDN